ncbi:cellulose biosynthesis protein BcsN [Mesorhizobium sp. M0938]|uniref:cellulose biosynthesis protein BcsN n=1 Tax=unclassified Mesorhizobium TaxID=325217 RepID=UPI0033380DD5
MNFAEGRHVCPVLRERLDSIRGSRLCGLGAASVLKITGLVLVLALGNCARPPPLVNSSGTNLVSAETAFAFPAPGGPAITAILERRFTNATQQDILLSTSARTPGQNMLRVQLYGPVDTSAAGQNRLRDGYLPIGDVGSEMRQLLPGIRMQRSPYYVQNKYGPFGYAAGRSASGDTCLYGWQRISSTGMTQTWVGNKGSIQIRLRLCDQNASEQRLLDVMYSYTITSSFKTRNWNPYGEPAAPDASLGKAGQPIYPVGISRFETVTGPPPAAQPRQSKGRVYRTQRQASVEPPAVSPEPTPVGPMVPPPPGAESANSQVRALPLPPPVSAAERVGNSAVPTVPPPPCVTDATGGCK